MKPTDTGLENARRSPTSRDPRGAARLWKIEEAIELREERERIGYRVELQWEEPDVANASASQREAAWALLRGRPSRYRGPWMKRSVSGLSLFDAEKQGRRMARDPAKRSVNIIEFTGGQSVCYRRY